MNHHPSILWGDDPGYIFFHPRRFVKLPPACAAKLKGISTAWQGTP
jgi:hypothetical protein